MFDFSLDALPLLISGFIHCNYEIASFNRFLSGGESRKIVLRHDVDKLPKNSLKTAQIEHSLNIKGTYYFRIVKESNDPQVIKAIADLGHEIGYHYEDLALCTGDKKKAIESFQRNLDYFRTFYPVKTICMHGSPLSKYDNRDLWEEYDYRDYGIIGEPYFDVDFSKVFYLTDTGRRWDGDSVSVRDKVQANSKSSENAFSHLKFRSTFDIIKAAQENKLPDQMMITVHPQRWHDSPLPWVKELVAQNVKNVVKKYFIVKPSPKSLLQRRTIGS